MKKSVSYVLGIFLLGGIFYGAYLVDKWVKTPNKIKTQTSLNIPQKPSKTSSAQKNVSSEGLSFPEEFWNQPVTEQETTDINHLTTTQQLDDAFHVIYRRHIRPIYLDNFPSDFAVNGNSELFIKVIMALVLRENKNINKDRAFLIKLYDKLNQKTPWNETETARFNELVSHYGVTEQKINQTQIEELLKRVDIIPPSLAIAMAGVHTNWGKTALKSPFGQKEWINGVYTEKEFDTLTAAVQAYMMELNSLPIYNTMRINRKIYRNLRGSLGEKLIDTVDSFMPENTAYTRQLRQAFKDKRLTELDNAIIFE